MYSVFVSGLITSYWMSPLYLSDSLYTKASDELPVNRTAVKDGSSITLTISSLAPPSNIMATASEVAAKP
jgi:hypothetical protein